MTTIVRVLAVCALLTLGACASFRNPFGQPIDLPATFQGTLSCGDCEGLETTLSLRTDGLYFLRQRKLGTTPVRMSVELGRWQFVDGKRRVELDGDTKRSFGVATPAQLVTADLVHHLDRLPQWNPIGGPVALRGEYVSVEGAPRLKECKTGRTFPVAMVGDNRALEASYLALRAVTGAPMLATFEGRLARVAQLADKSESDAFVVDKFERLWPSASCTTRLAVPLVNTRWRLVELEGVSVDVQEGSPELTFGENGRLTGSTGCNRLNAPYTRRDAAVSLGPLGATRSACAEPTKRDLETRFGAMLRDVDGFALDRTQLVLMHGTKEVSRFVAGD